MVGSHAHGEEVAFCFLSYHTGGADGDGFDYGARLQIDQFPTILTAMPPKRTPCDQ